ncbi:MAG: hypothetical protein COA91_13180 [Robiginitomaculum sp.]|nr:MAG: hypothetical protein COA91_13180 [Robiginitomaculum sp.]
MKKLRDLLRAMAHIATWLIDGITMSNFLRTLGLIGLGVILSSCVSVKIPDFDFVKFPEFRQDAENIADYPKVENAAQLPENIRSDQQWDTAVKKIMTDRDGLSIPNIANAKTDTEIENEMKKLGEQVNAYKKDDPE